MNFNPGSWLKNKGLYKYLAAIPIPAFIILIAVLSRLNIAVVFEPPLLLFILNTVFIFAVFLSVAYISARSYLAGGSLNILLLGCGMLIFGSGSLLAGLLIGAPGGTNLSVAIFNIAALAGSIIHFAGAGLTLIEVNPELELMRRKLNVIISYLGVLAFIVFLMIADLRGAIPLFFIQGVGPTLLRQIVLGTAVILFSVSALFFMRLYLQSKENFLYWYSLALMLIAIGLSGVFFQSTVGSPASWAGRSAQYLGGIYFFIAILGTIRKARTKGIPLEKTIATFFREPEANFRVLVETANDAIVSFDNEGRVLMWNSAAEKIFGYNRSEAVGSILSGLIIPDSYADIIKTEAENLTLAGKSTQIGKTIEMVAKNKGGKEFPVEFSVSARKTSDGWMYTSIIRNVTERKRAEEALRESEQRLRRFYESGLVGVMYWNMNGAITDANDKFLEMVGYTREELAAGQIDWTNMTPPEYRHLDENSVAELKATGVNKVPFEKEYICKDGTCIPIIVAGAMLDEAHFNGVAFVLDITERKKAEKALKESEQRWATTLASIGDAVISTDIEGRITFMNAEAEKLTGWTLAEASTRPVTEVFNIINEYTRREADNPVRRVLQEGIIVGLANHTILVRKDVTEVPIDDSGAPIRDGDGRTMGVVLVFRDITERKQAEEALRSAEAKFRILVEQSLVGTYITQDKKIIYVNPKLAEILGYTQDEIISSKSVSDLIVEEDSDKAIENIRKRLRGEVQSIQHTFRGKRKDGILIDLEVHGTRTELDGKTVVIGTALDITERKRAEEDINRHNAILNGINTIFKEALTCETEEELGQACLEVLEEITCSKFGFIGEIGSDGLLHDIAISNPGWELCTMYDKRGHHRPPGNFNVHGLYGRVILDGKPFFTNDPVSHPDSIGTPEGHPPLSAFLGVPLIDGGKTIGMVGMGNRENGYRTDDLEVLETLGTAIVQVFKRKRAEGELRKAHDELEARVKERTAELEEANKALQAEITERKRAEEALIENEQRYRELTESIDDLFYAMDRELRYTYWNKASEALTGILAKDAIGKSLLEIFPDVKGTKVEQFYIEALKTQQPQRFENEYQLGEKKYVFEVSAYPTKIGLSVIAKDITERKMLEAQLLRAQRMESIGTLAGGIAHDLNNMLTPIMMSLQMFKEKYKDEQSQRLLNILENNSQRSADLIKQVLSFARGVEGERNPLAAKHIITEIEKIAKETFPRNIEIRTDIPKDLYTILGDATQLHQVIMNLCVNARDAMPDGGTLSISAKNFSIDENYSRMHTEAKIGSYIIVEVSDTGTGIPPKVLDRIFEPFFTTKEFGKGTGLGLSTALAIVKSHGGFINVNSEVGKGTTFGVYLPAIKTEIQSIDEKQPELFMGRGEFILVAEDEDSVREVTISTLEKNGYRVLTACDGVEAISSYAQNMEEIKVILMDMMMPVMDGHASIRAIRRINPEVKIIAVSGLAEKDKLKNVSDYTNAFLPKPYNAEKLLKTINEVLNAK